MSDDIISRLRKMERNHFAVCGDAAGEIERLRARVSQLASALKPFADQAAIIEAGTGKVADCEWFRFRGSITAITFGDCRAAQTAMKEAM